MMAELKASQRTRDSRFNDTLNRLTREAVKESLAEIEKAFDALIADRDEWQQQHENLLAVRQSDISALATRPALSPNTSEAREEAAKLIRDHLEWLEYGVEDENEPRDESTLVDAILAALPLAPREGWQEEVGEALASAWREACDYLDHYAEYIRSVHSSELERHPYLPALERVAGSMRAALSRTGEMSRGTE